MQTDFFAPRTHPSNVYHRRNAVNARLPLMPELMRLGGGDISAISRCALIRWPFAGGGRSFVGGASKPGAARCAIEIGLSR